MKVLDLELKTETPVVVGGTRTGNLYPSLTEIPGSQILGSILSSSFEIHCKKRLKWCIEKKCELFEKCPFPQCLQIMSSFGFRPHSCDPEVPLYDRAFVTVNLYRCKVCGEVLSTFYPPKLRSCPNCLGIATLELSKEKMCTHCRSPLSEKVSLDEYMGVGISAESFRSEKGLLFRYEALPANASFASRVLVPEEVVDMVKEVVKEGLLLGHGISRGFGRISVKILGEKDVKDEINRRAEKLNQGRHALWLVTPAVDLDLTPRGLVCVLPDLYQELKRRYEEVFKIEPDLYISEVRVLGLTKRVRLGFTTVGEYPHPKPIFTMLEEGSVVEGVIVGKDASKCLATLLYLGMGRFTEYGYGEVRLIGDQGTHGKGL